MPDPARTSVEAWAPAARAAAAGLVALSRGCLPLLLAAAIRATDPPLTLPLLVNALLVLSLVPGLAARAARRAARAEADVSTSRLVLARRGLRVEVPLASIEGVLPWRVPLPGPGFALRLRSGARLRWAIGAADPAPVLRLLADAGVGAAGAALSHPSIAWAQARAAEPRRFWQRPLVKFALFALLPGGAAFSAHQHIAYGGLLGEWYLLGAAAWLRDAAEHWLHAALLLVLWASLWRALAEGFVAASTARAPAAARALRRAAERGAGLAYYASVPALLALRFLA